MYERFQELLRLKHSTVAQLCRDTGLNESSLSNWKKRNKGINTETLVTICKYYNVSTDWLLGLSDSMTEYMPLYYIDNETAVKAQEIFDNPDLRSLFDAAQNSKPEDLQMVADMLKRFKETNPNG